MLAHIVTFVLGVVASVLVWLFTTKFSQVKIVFPQEIFGDTHFHDNSMYHYNIEVTNVGRRELIDLHMQAKITIGGADKRNPGLRNFALLNLDYFCNYPSLPYKGAQDKAGPQICTGRLIYAINMEGAYYEFAKIFYDEDIRKKAKAKTLELNDVFNTYPDAAIQFYLFGYDAFTGARKMYKSKYYCKSDIRFIKVEN